MEELNVYLTRLDEIYNGHLAFFNSRGKVLAHNGDEESRLPDQDAIHAFVRQPIAQDHLDGFHLQKFVMPDESILVLAIADDTGVDERELSLITLWIREALQRKQGHSERISFLKNVLLENELPGDIPLKARSLKIDFHRNRKAILLRLERADDKEITELLLHLIPSDFENYLIPMDEENLLILFDMDNLLVDYEPEDEDEEDDEELELFLEEELEDLLYQVLEELDELIGRPAKIGTGLIAETLKDIARSYREASLALTVGSIFEDDQRLMRYDQLGLGRLIYQLPPTLCELFLSEVFKPNTYEQLDNETLITIEKFFENNLNGSETSRRLFVHRNTLVYRLDKVEKITGLDLRIFDDAVLFKLASMVRKYLESLKKDESGGPGRSRNKRRTRNQLD